MYIIQELCSYRIQPKSLVCPIALLTHNFLVAHLQFDYRVIPLFQNFCGVFLFSVLEFHSFSFCVDGQRTIHVLLANLGCLLSESRIFGSLLKIMKSDSELKDCEINDDL